MTRLDSNELADALQRLPGWSERHGGIETTYGFPDYYRVIAFVNAVAYVANRDDHHPDLGVHFDKVVVRYTSHDAGGVTERDVAAAAKVAALHD